MKNHFIVLQSEVLYSKQHFIDFSYKKKSCEFILHLINDIFVRKATEMFVAKRSHYDGDKGSIHFRESNSGIFSLEVIMLTTNTIDRQINLFQIIVQ